MNEIQPVASVLSLENMYIDECTFVRSADPGSNAIEYEFNFNREIKPSDDQEHFAVSLRCNLWEKNSKAIEIHVRVVGEFLVQSADEIQKKGLVEKNTLTILFPILRSQIILLTSQTGIPPVTIPVLNIAEMFRDR